MKSSVHIEEPKSTKLSNLLPLLLRKITAAVTRREKTEGSNHYEKKISLATIAAGSLFSILIIVLLVLNGWLVGGSGDNFYARQIVLGFLGIANIVFWGVWARSNVSWALAGNDRPSSEPDGCDRFFSLSLDLLCVISFDGYVKRINPAGEKILGYSPGEMVGQLFIEFVHPDDRETTLKEAESLAAGNNTVGFENRWRCRNGSYKWIAWTGTRFWEEELMYGVGRDITDRKQAEAALQSDHHIGNPLRQRGVVDVDVDWPKTVSQQPSIQRERDRIEPQAFRRGLPCTLRPVATGWHLVGGQTRQWPETVVPQLLSERCHLLFLGRHSGTELKPITPARGSTLASM